VQFKVGDRVVHPTHGLGSVVKIEEREFSDKGRRMYYQVNFPKSTVWIPVRASGGSGLRLVTAQNELDRYRDLLKSAPVPLHQNHTKRQLQLASHLKQGSFQGVCEVVRDLTAWGRQKTLGATDNATLKKTRANLYQEWAGAAGVTVAEATKEVESLLQLTVAAPLS
jgi:RNA polymerase-interacting CarD/CdnL/TRCF family regulator